MAPKAPDKLKDKQGVNNGYKHKSTGGVSKKGPAARVEKSKKAQDTPSAGKKIAGPHKSTSHRTPSHQAATSRSGTLVLPDAADVSPQLDTSNTANKSKINGPIAPSNGMLSNGDSARSSSSRTPFIKTASATPNVQVSDPLQLPLNMGDMPAEVQQLIWGYVIMTPACHTFKIIKFQPRQEWLIDLLPGATGKLDMSAYRQWKICHSLKNIGCQTVFQRFTKTIQPITLKKNGKARHRQVAAIDEEQDLVILDFDRAESRCSAFSWWEHVGPIGSLQAKLVRKRLRHFRKVAIIWKDSHASCVPPAEAVDAVWMGIPFYCYCHITVSRLHQHYKADPNELACFLDLFPELEQFFIVVEATRAPQKSFVREFRGMHDSFHFADSS